MGKRSAGKPLSYSTNGDFARRSREQLGLSQAKFAAKCSLSERTIRDIESGLGASSAAIQFVASQLNLPNWHDLITDRERSRFPGNPTVTPVSISPTAPVRPIVNRLFQLPSIVADFTGREDEFRRMVERLRRGGGKVGVSVLCGMGGVGKTSLAVKVAHEVKDCFPDARLFLDLRGMSDQPVTAVEAMSRVIRDFHPETGKLAETETELLPHFRSVLSGKKTLIVLDNAKDESQVKPLLSADSSVAFLITSRNTLTLDGVEGLRLDVLSSDDAFVLLREIVGAKGTDAELRMVVELCGGLPLALRVAGDFLRLHDNWALPRYTVALKAERLFRLRSKKTDRAVRRWEDLDERAQQKLEVEAVLALSARQLVVECGVLAERWQTLSVFPANFGSESVADVWNFDGNSSDNNRVVDELTGLLDRSLLQFDAMTERYCIHDLLRPVARDVFEYVENHPLSPNSAARLRSAEWRFSKHFRYLLDLTNDLYQEGKESMLVGLALFDREVANIRCGQRWAAERRLDDAEAAKLCRDYPSVGANVIDLRLTARERVSWLESALDANRRLGDVDQLLGRLLGRGELQVFARLGNAHSTLGDKATAMELHQQSLAIAREVGDRRGEGNALGNLGNDYADLGAEATAIEHYELSMAIAREVGDRQGEGRALGNLGMSYAILGDLRRAIEYLEGSLAIAREVGDWRSEGQILAGFGNVHAALGDDPKSIEFHKQSLAIAREIGAQEEEGNALWNIALRLESMCRIEEAIQSAEHAVAIFEAIEHPQTNTVRDILAKWHSEGTPSEPN